MGKLASRFALALILGLVSAPAVSADHLDCMSKPMGAAEQIILDRQRDARLGDDKLSAEVQALLESRARVCAYLNGWSVSATRLAMDYKWVQVQWGRIPPRFNTDQQERLNVAVEPMRPRLAALLAPFADAIARGESPPPPPKGPMFRDFFPLLKAANIPQSASNIELLEGWLLGEGYLAAVVAAFSNK